MSTLSLGIFAPKTRASHWSGGAAWPALGSPTPFRGWKWLPLISRCYEGKMWLYCVDFLAEVRVTVSSARPLLPALPDPVSLHPGCSGSDITQRASTKSDEHPCLPLRGHSSQSWTAHFLLSLHNFSLQPGTELSFFSCLVPRSWMRGQHCLLPFLIPPSWICGKLN